MSDYRTNPGDVFADVKDGARIVVSVLRPEDIGRFTDGKVWRGSTAERCALHGGQTRPQPFEVRN